MTHVHPRMADDGVDARALRRIVHKEQAYKGLCVSRHKEGHTVLALYDALPKLLQAGAVERKATGH